MALSSFVSSSSGSSISVVRIFGSISGRFVFSKGGDKDRKDAEGYYAHSRAVVIGGTRVA